MSCVAMLIRWNVVYILYLFSGYTVVLAAFEGPPVVEKSIGSEYIPELSTLTLRCVTNSTVLSYSWLKNDQRLSNQSSPTYTFDVQRTDGNASYWCNVTYAEGKSELSSPIVVKVSYMSDPVLVSSTLTPTRGSNVTLTCMVNSSDPLVTGYGFNNSLVQVRPLDPSNSYLIQNIQSSQNSYVCFAKNGFVTKVSNSITLSVENVVDRPKLSMIPEVANEGDTVTLSCKGNGSLSFSYFNGSSPVSATFNATRFDDGSYFKCIASVSGILYESDPIRLVVGYMDPPIATFNESSERILLNDTVVLNCKMGSTNINGSVSYSWAFQSVSIVGAGGASLTLRAVRAVDRGDYSCSVSLRGITKVSNTLTLNVLFPPTKIDFDVPERAELIGKNFAIMCSARGGNPESYNVSWSKPPQSNATHVAGKLTFQPVSRADSGLYTCSARNGIGNPITESISFKALGVPDPPTDLRVLAKTATTINLTWLAPAFDGNANVTGFSVDLAVASNEAFKSPRDLTDTSALIEQLEPATSYYFRVRARNSYGFGAWSLVLGPEATLESVPGPPRIQWIANHTSGLLALEVSWLEPLKLNGVITSYAVCYEKRQDDLGENVNEPPTCTSNLSPSSRAYNITAKLDPYSTYLVSVGAINSAGSGPVAENFALTREGVPSKVQSIAYNVTADNIALNWTPSPRLYGTLSNYEVRYSKPGDSSPTRVCIGTDRTCTIANLAAYTNYSVSVVVANGYGSTASDEKFIRTSIGAPPIPSGEIPMPSIGSDTSITYQLVKFSDERGPIEFYQVIAVRLKSADTPAKSTSTYGDAEIARTPQKDFLVPFVVAEFRASRYDEFKSFVLGAGGRPTSREQVRSRRSQDCSSPALYSNPKLESDTYYTVFQRAFVSCSLHASTAWFPPAKTKAASGLGGGPIAGIVIAIVVVVALLITLAVYKWKHRRQADQFEEVEIKIKRQQKSFRSITTPPIHDPRVSLSVDRFEDHVNQLKANSNYGFSQEYLMINRELDQPYEAARLPENNIKNRYHNVPAYDHSRFKLFDLDGDSECSSDYINANYIEGFYNKREYIATQGPLPETIMDFWKMVWESDTTTIVMLTRLEEKSRVKCAQYWPESGTLTVRDIIITTTEVHEFPDHVVRTLHVTKTGQAVEKLIKQFHFMAWPDFGVPDDPSSILAFIRKINKWRGVTIAPVVIHCSAGVGRTGTYITIDSQIHNIKKNKEINVYTNVTLIREQRCLMVQTEDQYIFIHDALLDYLDSGDTEIEANELREYIKRQSQVDPRSGMTGLMEEFIRLAKSDKKDKYTEANKHVNEAKNRYKNVSPYDETRVKLSVKAGVDGSDYINANYIDSYANKDSFIATQAPLESTLNDFWRMIWEQNCGAIVMLTKDMEAGQMKAFPYWPQKVPIKSGVYLLETLATTTYGEYVVRELKLTNTEASSSRVVRHFQFTGWPEQGSPESGFGIIDLIGQVQKWNASNFNKIITVHCSAGVGRTGVFIALTNLIERLKTEAVVDVYQAVKKMRQQRTAMVQTRDQYEFCYRALQEYLDSFDLYSNFN